VAFSCSSFSIAAAIWGIFRRHRWLESLYDGAIAIDQELSEVPFDVSCIARLRAEFRDSEEYNVRRSPTSGISMTWTGTVAPFGANQVCLL
jgi:hypothetical protein